MNNNVQHFDSIIIGAGPSGLFTAHRILEKLPKAKVLLIEKGRDIQFRNCKQSCSTCPNTLDCNVLCGVGGSGLFSDGKLVLDLHSGGLLDSVSNITEQKKTEFSHYIENTLRKFDGVSQEGPVPSVETKKEWSELFNRNGLEIKHYNVLHMGSRNLKNIITNFVNNLKSNKGFHLLTAIEVVNVYKNNGYSIVEVSDGRTFASENIVFSTGKTGTEWLKKIFKKNKISFKKTTTYVGVRIETAHDNIAKLFDFSFDPKIWMFFNNHKVKTHCFCRHGDVICTNYMGFPVVGGQTQITEKNEETMNDISDKSNFNILVSTSLDSEKILCMINAFKNINPYGPVVQTVTSFINKTIDGNSVHNVPHNTKNGDIRKIFDSFDGIGNCISEFICRLSRIIPGVNQSNSLIYAPSVEWLMDTVNVMPNMETSCEGWFAIGDGAGLSQGIVHAAATGIIAADEICLRIENE